MAIVFPNGTQNGAVLQTRQCVFNGISAPSVSSDNWTNFGIEANLTPISSNSYIRFTWCIPFASPNSLNSTVRIARRIGGSGTFGETSSNLQSSWDVTRPRGQHMSVFFHGGNWSYNSNLIMQGIDNPGTTSTVWYRPELMTNNSGSFYIGFNNSTGGTGNGYSRAPTIIILEELDPDNVSSLDAI